MRYAWFIAILINKHSRIYITGVIQINFSDPFFAELMRLKQHHSLIPNTKQRLCLLLMKLLFNRHNINNGQPKFALYFLIT